MFPGAGGDPDPANRRAVRLQRREPGGPADRTRRQPLLRGLRRRPDPPRRVRPSRRRDRDEPDERTGAAHRRASTAPDSVPGPARRHAHVRLGPRRRRRVRRLHRSRSRPSSTTSAAPTPCGSGSRTSAADPTSATPITIIVDNGAPTATILTPLPTLTWKVGDIDRLLRRGDRSAGRSASAERALVVGHHPPLSVDVPHARLPDVRRRRERQLPGARPRVPVVPRDPADGDRQRRSDRQRRA